MKSDRMEQIDELILRELAVIIQKELPDFFISITNVDVSKDLAHAKVWVTEIRDTEVATKELNRERSVLRKLLAEKVQLRKIPALHFLPDHSTEKAGRIEKLLSDIKEEEKDA